MKIPVFLRPFLGAIGGAVVALVVFQGYAFSAPVVRSWIATVSSSREAKGYTEADRDGRVRLIRQRTLGNLRRGVVR